MSYQKIYFFICFGFLCNVVVSGSDADEMKLNSLVLGFSSAFDDSPCTRLQYAINVQNISGSELDLLVKQPDVDLFKSVQLIMRDGVILEEWLDKGRKPYLGHMHAKAKELRDKYVLCSSEVPQKVIVAVDEYLTGNEKLLLLLLKNKHDINMIQYVQSSFLETVYNRFSDILDNIAE